MKLTKNKGFTLIEIVIVMVILGILAVSAIPKYVDLKQKAVEVSMETELQTIYRALYTYHSIHGRMPNELSEVVYIVNIDNKYELNPQGRIV